jgi:hypothetical protein
MSDESGSQPVAVFEETLTGPGLGLVSRSVWLRIPNNIIYAPGPSRRTGFTGIESTRTQGWRCTHRTMTQHERFIMEAAIVGLQSRRDKINRKIGELRAMLDGDGLTTGLPETRHKGTVSTVARKRMAAAQRRRWREYKRKNQR